MFCCSVVKLCDPWTVACQTVTLWTVALQTPLSMGILQARILEWVVMSSSRGSSQPRDWTQVFCTTGRFFNVWAQGSPRILEWVAYPFSRVSFLSRNWIGGGLDAKVSACNAGDPGSISQLGSFSWRREWKPTPVFLPGESHGQWSLVGYSSWDRKVLNMT